MWLQGETDAEALRVSSWVQQRVQSANDYAQKLTQVINKSKQDLSSDLTWMVGKASTIYGFRYNDMTKTAQERQSAITVRDGQEQVISSGLVKRGPDIDQILERNPNDNTHLFGAGLWKAADAWFSALQISNLLISNFIRPQSLGTEPRTIEVNQNGDIITGLPSGARYVWYSGNSSGSIDLNTPVGYGQSKPNGIGNIQVIIEDQSGNYTLTDRVLTTANPPTNPPVNPLGGTCSVSNPNSALDFADCNGLGGWALDQNNMGQPVLVDIYVDGVKTYAGVTANNDRQDLVQYLGVNGRYHGFSYSFPADAAWKNGQNHTISVRICGVNNDINGSPKTVSGCTGGSTTTNPPTNPPTNPSGGNTGGSYEGYIDISNCDGISGWVWNSSDGNAPVTIEFLDGSSVIGSTVASTYRQDLQQAGKGNGQHGYGWSLPGSLKNGQPHSVSVRVQGNGYVLSGSPKGLGKSNGVF